MATTNELFELLPPIMEVGEVPMLVGHAGVGKTEVIRSIGRKHNREVIVLALSQMEPGDLIGMPAKDGDRTVWLKPEWWPKDGNTILFLVLHACLPTIPATPFLLHIRRIRRPSVSLYQNQIL